MSNTVSGSAVFKKNSGMLTIYEERHPPVMIWKSIDSSAATSIVEIIVTTHTNLQASKADSPKMMLRIISKNPTGGDDIANVFSFSNRPTMENIKVALQQIIARQKTSIQPDSQTSKSQQPLFSSSSLGDELASEKLLKNHSLQQKLLVENKQLMNTFKESVIKNSLDPEEFWSTRVHLLRTFALSNSQKRGPYNVLSTIKPVASSDNQVNVSVTREKIHQIFEQYPIVRKAYDDNVPKISEGEFWSRFFSSKLFRRLRGEKFNSSLRGDVILDKYLYRENEETSGEGQPEYHVSKFIDLEGNQEDNSQKLGNAPDMTMKDFKDNDMLSIFRSMNKLSEKMVSETKTTSTGELAEEKEKEEELYLSDLDEKEATNYIELHVNKGLSSNNTGTGFKNVSINEDFREFADKLRTSLSTPTDLSGVYNDSKKRSIEQASIEISNLIRVNSKQSKQAWNYNPDEVSTVVRDADPGVDFNILETIRSTHSTSVEFLRHFWLHFNSGDPSQQNNVKKLYMSVKKCKERVTAVLEDIKDEIAKAKATEYMKPLSVGIDRAISEYTRFSVDASKADLVS